MENVNTTESDVITATPLALPDALVGAENCRKMAENEIGATPGSIYKTGLPCKTALV
jgi:hypothetical protein